MLFYIIQFEQPTIVFDNNTLIVDIVLLFLPRVIDPMDKNSPNFIIRDN